MTAAPVRAETRSCQKIVAKKQTFFQNASKPLFFKGSFFRFSSPVY